MQWWTSWRRQGEPQPNPAEERDLLLSAYLDDDLGAPERAALERRLPDDTTLRDALDGLREVMLGLQRFEEVRAPRSFAVSADAARPARGLSRLELGVRAGAVAAVAAFVFVVGADVLGGGSSGVRGQASSDQLSLRSTGSNLASAPESSDASTTGGGAAAPERGAATTADDAVKEPTIVPTAFVVAPTATAPALPPPTPTPSSSQRQQAQQDATPAATAVPSRTPPRAVTSTSTMTSALQGSATATAPQAGAAAAATTTPPAAGAAASSALAPAQAPTGTPTPRPAVTSTATPAAPAKPEVTPPATGQGGGSSGAATAPSVPPAPPGPIVPAPTPTPTIDETAVAPSTAPAVEPPVPATGGVSGGRGGDSSLGSGLIAPAAEGGNWGQDATRVSVIRQNEVDTLRVAEAGLGALAVGLAGMTGWMWYTRRREAAGGI